MTLLPFNIRCPFIASLLWIQCDFFIQLSADNNSSPCIFISDDAPFLYYVCKWLILKHVQCTMCLRAPLEKSHCLKVLGFQVFLEPCVSLFAKVCVLCFRWSWLWRESRQLQFLSPLNPDCRTSTWDHTCLNKKIKKIFWYLLFNTCRVHLLDENGKVESALASLNLFKHWVETGQLDTSEH